MSYFGVAGSWIFVTLAATFNYAIAYQDSASFAQAKLTRKKENDCLNQKMCNFEATQLYRILSI